MGFLVLFLLLQFFCKFNIISESMFEEKSKKCFPGEEKLLLEQINVF